MPDVDIVFVGQDQVTSVMKGIGGSFAKLGKTVAGVGLLAGGAFVAGVTAAGVALTGFAVSGTKKAIILEQKMADIAGTMGKTTAEVKPLKDLILDLSLDPNLKVSAFEAAETVELLARNGVDASQIMGGMAKEVVVLANATGAQFGPAADLATDAMALFSKSGVEMEAVNQGVVAVLNKSKFSFDDYRLALANGGSAAAGFGVELNDFNAVIALTSSNFAGGAEAGTGFRNFIQRLVPGTDKAREAMQNLGLITEDGKNKFFDASGQLENMDEIVKLLSEAMGGLSEEQTSVFAKTVFGQDAMGTLLGIVNSGPEKFNALKASMAEVDPAGAVATRMSTTAGALEILEGTIEGVSLKIGDAFLPALQLIVAAVQTFVDENGDALIRWFSQATLWIGENLPSVLRSLAGFWTNTLTPAMATAWAFIRDNLIPAFSDIADFIQQNLPNAIKTATSFLNTVLIPAFSGMVSFVTNTVLPAFAKFGAWLTANLPGFLAAASEAFEKFKAETLPKIVDFVEGAIEKITEFKDDAVRWFNEFRAEAQPIIEEFAKRFQEVWEQAGPVVTDALVRIGDAFAEISSIFSTTTEESDTTAEAISTLEQVLDAVVISVEAVAVVLQGAAWSMEQIAEATKIASGLFEQFGQIAAAVGNKIPDILKPGSPPPLAIAMADIGKASLFATEGMDDFAGATKQASNTAKGLSSIPGVLQKIGSAANGASSQFSTFTRRKESFGAFGGQGKGFGALAPKVESKPIPPELIFGDQRLFEEVQSASGNLGLALDNLAKEASGTIRKALEAAATAADSSDLRGKKLEFLRKQFLQPFEDAAAGKIDPLEATSLVNQRASKLGGTIPEELSELKRIVREFASFPLVATGLGGPVEKLNKAADALLKIDALKSLQSTSNLFFGLNEDLAKSFIKGTTTLEDTMAKSISGFESNVGEILFERGLERTTATTNNQQQQMNLTINSSAPTENLAADFNMMQASISVTP